MNEKKVNILLVEDEDTHAEIIRRAFKDQNSTAVLRVVKSLEDARTAISENPPQLVLLDLLLPDGSGLDFLLSAGKNNEYPFIVITAHGDEAKAVQAMKAGALDYVVKSKETLADMPHICKRSIREWKNIIGRRKTEEELKQYHEQLEKLVEERTQEISRAIKFKENIISTIPSIIVVLNRKLEIVTVNRRFYEVFNIKKTDAKGLHFCKIIGCEDYNAKRKCELQINIKNIYTNRQKPIVSEEIVKRKNGNKILKVYISRISNEKEEETLLVIEDITKTRLLENQLVQSERLAAAGRLAASIAHEINNPLQSIITHLDLMKNGLPGDSKKFKNYNYVKSNIKRIGEIVGQLLDIYRSSDKVKTKVDINSLIHKVIELIDNQRQIKGIGLKLNLEKKLPYIYGWENQLHQIILNLLLNALENTVKEQQIFVSTFLRKKSVNISIKDTGKGIKAEEIKYIFDPFYSVKKKSGTGLGLFVCQGLVKNHNGEITVKSQEGKGSVFTIILPMVEME